MTNASFWYINGKSDPERCFFALKTEKNTKKEPNYIENYYNL